MNRLASEVTRLDEDMVELSVLMPGWQADELSAAAHDCGLTVGQMVRRLIRDFCMQQRQSASWHAPVAN